MLRSTLRLLHRGFLSPSLSAVSRLPPLRLGFDGDQFFTTMAVADEKLEPAGYVKVERRERHGLQDTSHLVYSLPKEWFSQNMSPTLKRERIVLRLTDWAKHNCVTPELLSKLMNGPLSRSELPKYSSNQIARIIYAVAVIKKANLLVGDARRVYDFLDEVIKEATDRKRVMTYDGSGLGQAAYGLALMELGRPELIRVFAEEAVKPHRIRNTFGKCVVNLLDALYTSDYQNEEHVRILSEAAVDHLRVLPGFALPRLLRTWAHYGYSNKAHVNATLVEALREPRLNTMVASHLEEILSACAKLKLHEPKVITLFVRELIYSQKWKLMHRGCLPRIIYALGELQYENPSHWQYILSAALNSESLVALESNMVTDIYVAWSRIAFRDSQLLEKLGSEATKKTRVMEYSTRQLFDIFKAQRALGQLEEIYHDPIVERLKDTEKLMKSNVETKIKIFLFPRIKKTLGMKNVASLAKQIFQPICLGRWSDAVLVSLANGLVPHGARFSVCFEEVIREVSREERIQELSPQAISSLLAAWEKLEFKDEKLQKFITECTKDDRIRSFSEQDLLILIWRFTAVTEDTDYEQLKPLFLGVTKRTLSLFTGKGLTMLLSCLEKTECLSKDETKPIVAGVMAEDKLAKLDGSLRNALVSALTAIGFDEEARIVRSKESDS